MKKGSKSIPLTFDQIRNLNPERLRFFLKEGLTQEQIAEKCGVNQTTISARIREYNLKKK